MRMKRLCSMAMGSLFLASTLSVGLAAQSAPEAEKKDTAPAAAPAPNPLAGITGVLGGVNLTGLIDAYYSYNANHPAGGTQTEPFTPINSQISLNLLELQLDKQVDKSSPLGFRVAVGWGKAIDAINNTGSDVANADLRGAAQYLKEAYASYYAPLGKGLTIDAGKFVTPAGAEVIESNQNWNYSRSLGFYYAVPYYHFGLRAKYVFNDKVTATAYLTNGWNNVVATNSGKTGGISLAWTASKKVTITENYLAGPRDFFMTGDNSAWNHLSDTVIAYNPNAKLSLLANIDYDLQEGYSGKKAGDYAALGLYAKYQATANNAFAARYEYFNDHAGLATAYEGGQHLNEFTATGEHKVANHLTLRAEYRHDQSNKSWFIRGGGGTAKGQDTAKIGIIFAIEPDAK